MTPPPFRLLVWKDAGDAIVVSAIHSPRCCCAGRKGGGGKCRCREFGTFWTGGPAARWVVETTHRTRKRRPTESQVRKMFPRAPRITHSLWSNFGPSCGYLAKHGWACEGSQNNLRGKKSSDRLPSVPLLSRTCRSFAAAVAPHRPPLFHARCCLIAMRYMQIVTQALSPNNLLKRR